MTLKVILRSDNGEMEKVLKALKLVGGLSFLKRKLSHILNKKLLYYGVSAELVRIQLGKQTNDDIQLHICGEIHEIDYERLEKRVFPLLMERVTHKYARGMVADILQILGEDQEKVLHAVLSNVDDKKKEKLMVLLLEEYQDVFCSKLTKVLKSNHIDFTVDRIQLEVGINRE